MMKCPPWAGDEIRQARIRRAWMAISMDQLSSLVAAALGEDIGHGDVTTTLTVPADRTARACFVAKTAGTISGLEVARRTLNHLNGDAEWTSEVQDGDAVEPDQLIATACGPAAAILTAERVALNFLQRMSGIASLTAQFVAATAHTSARILDTRKTAPGLRVLDKYAVVCGAGFNHRFGLGDGILIKDNHIQVAGGITQALTLVRESRPHGLKIEVEVDRLDQIEEALAAGAEIILLDNMTVPELSRAVELIGGRVPVEASGGVSLATAGAIAETGVDFISVGALTHSPPAMDIGLDFGA